MKFDYGISPVAAYIPPSLYKPYSYKIYTVPAPFEIVPEARVPLRPFENEEHLKRRLFDESADRQAALDPLNFPGDRAGMHGRQIDVLLEHLAARHAISYQIRRTLDYQEAHARNTLDDIKTWPIALRGPRRVSDLEKQLIDLGKERWAEEVSCWRDTGRVLADVIEHSTEFSENDRKARLMDDGF